MMRLANKHTRGFTLIELMIVIAIIGIISAIAYPSYDSYMKKSRRADAKAGLTRMADLQERFYLQNNTYASDVSKVGGADTKEGYYTLSISNADVNGYTLIATANAVQADDTGCTIMWLSSTGAKTSNGSATDDAANCW
jgi:type IV pilus assembly protein PilE